MWWCRKTARTIADADCVDGTGLSLLRRPHHGKLPLDCTYRLIRRTLVHTAAAVHLLHLISMPFIDFIVFIEFHAAD